MESLPVKYMYKVHGCRQRGLGCEKMNYVFCDLICKVMCEDHPFLLPACPYGHAYIPATPLL